MKTINERWNQYEEDWYNKHDHVLGENIPEETVIPDKVAVNPDPEEGIRINIFSPTIIPEVMYKESDDIPE